MNEFDAWSRSVGQELTLLKEDILFVRGDISRGPFLVLSGQIRLYRQDEDGREITLHRAHSGDHFAEASVFSEFYHCDCMAIANSTVLGIPKNIILAAFKNRPDFASLFADILAKQVMQLRTRLELRNIRAAEERILAALQLKTDGREKTVELDGTLKDFAGEIGLTHESLYRNLRKLEEKKLIRRNGRSFEVL